MNVPLFIVKDKKFHIDDPEIKGNQTELEALAHRITLMGGAQDQHRIALMQTYWNYYDPQNPSETADLLAGIITHLSISPENEEQQVLLCCLSQLYLYCNQSHSLLIYVYTCLYHIHFIRKSSKKLM